MTKKIAKLNHIKLEELYPNSYELLKNKFDNENKDKSELWMKPGNGIIEIISKDDNIIGEYDDNDMIYFLDLCGIKCIDECIKRTDGNIVETNKSKMLKKDTVKFTKPIELNAEHLFGKSPDEIKRFLIKQGMGILNMYIKNQSTKYVPV